MYRVEIIAVSDEYDLSELPLSAADYVNQAKGLARKERAAGMLLLGKLLKAEGIEEYAVSVTENGKPFLVGIPIHFSVSHAGGACAVAISDSPVGIDLQDADSVKRIKDPTAFVSRFFTVEESESFLNAPTHRELSRLWTKKEALVKLLGFRLSDSLSSLSTKNYPCVEFETSEITLDKLFYLTVATEINKQPLPKQQQ